MTCLLGWIERDFFLEIRVTVTGVTALQFKEAMNPVTVQHEIFQNSRKEKSYHDYSMGQQSNENHPHHYRIRNLEQIKKLATRSSSQKNSHIA
jgi:hypothetical protein